MAASSEVLSAATYALPLLLLTLGAIGWFARRKITSAGRVEKLDLASKLLDVRSKLRSPELTQNQIDHILKAAGVDSSLLPDVSQNTDNKVNFDGDEPAILSTTAVMSARLISQLSVIDAKIEQLMVILRFYLAIMLCSTISTLALKIPTILEKCTSLGCDIGNVRHSRLLKIIWGDDVRRNIHRRGNSHIGGFFARFGRQTQIAEALIVKEFSGT